MDWDRTLIKKYIDNQPQKIVTKMDLDKNKIEYQGILQGQIINEIKGDEEMPRSFILVLCQDLVQVKMRFSPILTCHWLFVLLQSTIQLFVVIWRHIIAMAMDSLGVVESLQIFEYQSICVIIIADFESIQPFALNQ